MLVAGASIGGISSIRGALAFAVAGLPSGTDWNVGSAKNTLFNTRLNISRYWRDLNNGFYFNKIPSL